MLRSLAGGDLDVPPGVRQSFPATFHLNLLPEARGKGIGLRLAQVFIERMRSLQVPGIHAQTLSVNQAVTRFNKRLGFQIVARRPLHAFALDGEEPIAIHTWVMPL